MINDINEMISQVSARYDDGIRKHARDEVAMKVLVDTAIADAITTYAIYVRTKFFGDDEPGKNLGSAG